MSANPRTHDLTRRSWGHNITWIKWDSASGTGTAHVWLTPGPREGDTIIVPSKLGTMPLRVAKSQWLSNVDDMYKIHLARPEAPEHTIHALEGDR